MKSFEIHVNQNTVEDSNLTISWCLSKELVEKVRRLEAEEGAKFYVLISILNENGKETQFLEPLHSLIAYINFSYAGKNIVWAAIVKNNTTRDSTRSCRYHYIINENPVFEYIPETLGEFFNNQQDIKNILIAETAYKQIKDGDDSSYFTVKCSDDSCVVFVLKDDKEDLVYDYFITDVPQSAFPKPPPEWLSSWCHWLRFNSKDQCEFRRTLIFSLTIQPFIFLFIYTMRLIWFVINVLCANKVSVNALIHPLTCGIEYMVENPPMSQTYLTIKSWGRFKRILWLVHPLALIGYVLTYVYFDVILNALMACYPFISTLLLGVCLGGILLLILHFIIKKLPAPAQNNEYDLLVCNGNDYTDYKNLPKHKRTKKLWFKNMKAKVCRPYQGR